MEELTNLNLQLVLGIKEGAHFDRVQKPTVIKATLNGRCLESKQIQSDCNPQYTTDLIWEIDKNEFRKMRCNQTPIKVECYIINDNDSREKLGHILLSVRCAQVIQPDKESTIKTNWHNLLGVRNEFSTCKPQLLLYLIVKENDRKVGNTVSKDVELDQLNYLNIAPVWLQEEHLIQLGPLDLCKDIFTISITAETISNLRQLLKEFKENSVNITLIYNIFDIFITLKPFKLEANNMLLNEKVIIKIRTSLPVLMNYLKIKSNFVVKVKSNNITIGQADVTLKPLITTNCLHEFVYVNKNVSEMNYCCVLKSILSKEAIEHSETDEDIHRLPNLKINIKLQYVDLKDNFNKKKPPNLHNSSGSLLSRNDALPLIDQYNYLDQANYSNVKHVDTISQHIVDYSEKGSTRLPYTSPWEKGLHSFDGSQIHGMKSSKCKSLHSDLQNSEKCIDIYKSYCLSIHLNAVKFMESNSDVKCIELRFYDSHGGILTTVCNDVSIVADQVIQLEGVKCKVHFIAASDKIEQLFTTFVPKISICDATFKERRCIAQASVDIEKLLYYEKPKSQFEISLIDCHNHKEIGCADVTVILEDYLLPTSNKIKNNPDILFNNSMAYKIVDELETWKERQKEMFKDELRKKEESHLTLLNEEWQRRRECLEARLARSVLQCKTLANNLNKTTENFRLRKIQSFQKEKELIQANEQLQWKYDRKIHQLQDALQKMQEEFSSKLRSLEEQNEKLLSQIDTLNAKNIELENIKTEQREKLEENRKFSTAEDQTTVLQKLKILEEKLDKAQKSKTYFKEQCNKAVKEIHKLKIENDRALVTQVNCNKEDLNNLALEEILHAGSTALNYDRIALNQIQHEIDIMNPESTLHYLKPSTHNEIYDLQSDLYLNLEHKLLNLDTPSSSSISEDILNVHEGTRYAYLKKNVCKQ